MPYFIYKIHGNQRFELVESKAKYAEARQIARSMRASLGPDDDYSVRMIFAGSTTEAERLLREKREPRPIGEE